MRARSGSGVSTPFSRLVPSTPRSRAARAVRSASSRASSGRSGRIGRLARRGGCGRARARHRTDDGDADVDRIRNPAATDGHRVLHDVVRVAARARRRRRVARERALADPSGCRLDGLLSRGDGAIRVDGGDPPRAFAHAQVRAAPAATAPNRSGCRPRSSRRRGPEELDLPLRSRVLDTRVRAPTSRSL